MRAIAPICILALSITAAFPQSANPRFDVADVHVSTAPPTGFSRGGALHGRRYELKNATMLGLITTAYGMDDDKVLGGPSWLEMDRFDVIALAPARTAPETLRLMLQSLLSERFSLKMRQESKPMPGYVLKAGSHPQLKEADGSGDTGCRISIQGAGMRPVADGSAPPVPPEPPMFSMSCRNVSMSTFADEVRNLPGANGGSRPVVDQTGLKGLWNVDLKYTLSISQTGFVDAGGAQLPDALEKQAGLKLELTTLPVPTYTVESVNQKPTPNSVEDMKAFPPLPTEFEVAEIKPSKSDSATPAVVMLRGGGVAVRAGRGGGRGGVTPMLQNGRVNLQGMTLKNLITLAWDLISDDALAGAPKWLDTDRFDVIAEVPSVTADAFTDLDSIKPMLRNLLQEKFKITFHTEERPVPGYVLTAVKPKLKKADSAARAKYFEGPGPDGKDPRTANPALSRLVTFQNITMAQFAAALPNTASGYLRTPIKDETGLDGAWDFTLNFSAAGIMNGGGRGGRGGDGAPAGASLDASDPSGGISLFDAITKQLGLKLDLQKRPGPVMVLDHVEQKPVE